MPLASTREDNFSMGITGFLIDFPSLGINSRKRRPWLDILGGRLREVQLYHSIITKSKAEEETKRNVWKLLLSFALHKERGSGSA